MIYSKLSEEKSCFTETDLQKSVNSILDKLGERKKVLVIPPDFTRYHSFAGIITQYAFEFYKEKLTDILPALGTHAPMSEDELIKMFRNIPKELFQVHDWRKDLVTLGEVPSDYISEISEGKVDFSWPAQTNKLLVNGGYDLILSIGQVVPHEVIGMANYNKNIFVGVGGVEGINKSHYLGAVYGMERIMGRADNPVRQMMNYATDHFTKEIPIVYIQTVVGKDNSGKLGVKGIFASEDSDCFYEAAELSLKENFIMLDKPLKKVVVYLDPDEFKSTWLGNKSIYRTRMAIADKGELIVIAPGVKEFGEDKGIDALIRKYGYVGTDMVLKLVNDNDDLKNNLSAAAHLIHGSSENRFSITYCPEKLMKQEIENVNFKYISFNEIIQKYNPDNLKDGVNILPDGEEIFYISNPALGLWASKERFIN
ncbi:lactate racemase domain-containing protein [Bacteroidota bacterium]